jgi:hypothetical protein
VLSVRRALPQLATTHIVPSNSPGELTDQLLDLVG